VSQPLVLLVIDRDRLDSPLRDELERLLARLAAAPGSVVGDVRRAGAPVEQLRSRSRERQRAELVALLEQCGGNLSEVARRLGRSRGAVTYRARKFGLLAPRATTRRGGEPPR